MISRIIDYAKKYEDIIIYGAGVVAKKLGEDLLNNNVKIKCYVVSTLNGQNLELNGIPVRDVKTEKLPLTTGIVVGVSLGKVQGIKNKLSELGRDDYITLDQEYIDTVLVQFSSAKMEITTEIACKVNCKYCPQKLLISRYFEKNKNRKKTMNLSEFKGYLDKIPVNVQIYFAGMVEPFQNKECIDMVRYAINRGYAVGILTTCVGINEDMAKELVAMPIESFIIHVPDEDNYAKIPLNEEYWKVVSIFLNAKKANGENFIDAGSCQGIPLNHFLDINQGRVRIESYLHDRAGNLDNTENRLESCQQIEGSIYCYHSKRLEHNILLPDGTVTLCCMDYALEHEIGNLGTEAYEEIIDGQKLMSIRRAMIDNHYDILCRHCTYAIKY